MELRHNPEYKARVAAFNADPELIAARAAYRRVYPMVTAEVRRCLERAATAARERQQPGIHATEDAKETAELAFYNTRMNAIQKAEQVEHDKDIAYAIARNLRGIPGLHERPERRLEREEDERYGGW